jgi:hypothetical protein
MPKTSQNWVFWGNFVRLPVIGYAPAGEDGRERPRVLLISGDDPHLVDFHPDSTIETRYGNLEALLIDAVMDPIPAQPGWVAELWVDPTGRAPKLLGFLDYEPGMGRLVVVESLGARATALERRWRVLAQIIAAVDQGRLQANKGDGPPPLTAEGVVGGVFSLIHSRLLEGGGGPLVELLNPLMSMIVLPYLGPAAARRELDRPVPKAPTRPRPVNGDPLRDLEMRLTYRTVRVLMAVAANPGSSNRMVPTRPASQTRARSRSCSRVWHGSV